ncbi:LytR C-terminal domain-containing protein [Nocardioides sp. ChNu-153]|uniref:LytR C-terminal domain-containing protein n=1 Tax=unclassified Nocardioides TaxID=2615069 RepID=UPI0024072786|nr:MULTISPECIES: LytR C-terminal domain-containing protein [unclassified Nocardioides]MDF9716064.1 LytR C-terminal domain-containing protein [Nocardioides sp. ChNu-99]MDN7120340.1 LytR C-terminal domain-containing protein [Nocardioides sp. ChNu-153]
MRTRRDDRGAAYPAPLVMLSVIAVAMAGLAFALTGGDDRDDEVVTAAQPAATSEATPTETATSAPAPPPAPEPPPVDRAQVVVEVFNNSGIRGLASRTGDEAAAAGWQVVGSDNWVGTIPASTVYFPERLEREAQLLAEDLGITRLMPAVDPMRGDRLTVILTADRA